MLYKQNKMIMKNMRLEMRPFLSFAFMNIHVVVYKFSVCVDTRGIFDTRLSHKIHLVMLTVHSIHTHCSNPPGLS